MTYPNEERFINVLLSRKDDIKKELEYIDSLLNLYNGENVTTSPRVVLPSLNGLDFKKLRKAKNLTLRDVEDKIGISTPYLSQLESGKIKSPSFSTVKKLCDLYCDFIDKQPPLRTIKNYLNLKGNGFK